jgi:hypothetical protein
MRALDELAAHGRDAEPGPEERPRRGRAQAHDDPGAKRRDLAFDPSMAGVDLALGPKGRPFLSSSSPGCSPTSITSACGSPAPKTVWVPVFHSGQSWQSLASRRSCVKDLGMRRLEFPHSGRFPKKRK